MRWYVFKRSKATKNVQTIGPYATEAEAKATMKEHRELDQYKVYSWSVTRA